MKDLEWIRESNLIEDIDDPEEDRTSLRAWIDVQHRSWSMQTILDLHHFILQHQRPEIAGKLRTCNVEVGGRTCPLWVRVPMLLEAWGWAHDYGSPTTKIQPTEAMLKDSHIQFEKIHPFEDGNGRVGRMLMNWLRVSRGFEPLLIRASERQEYYKWFR